MSETLRRVESCCKYRLFLEQAQCLQWFQAATMLGEFLIYFKRDRDKQPENGCVSSRNEARQILLNYFLETLT